MVDVDKDSDPERESVDNVKFEDENVAEGTNDAEVVAEGMCRAAAEACCWV